MTLQSNVDLATISPTSTQDAPNLGQDAASPSKPAAAGPLGVGQRDQDRDRHSDRSGVNHHHDALAAPVDTVSGPLLALEEALRERSNGTMIAAFRDVWMMTIRHHCDLVYQDAMKLLERCGRYELRAGIGEPVMVRPRADSAHG